MQHNFPDYRFLVPLLTLPYPVYHALRVAMNQTKAERMLRFVDWVCRENSIQKVEVNAFGNVKDHEWQAKRHKICLQMVTADFGEEILIFTRTWKDNDWKSWQRRLEWRKWAQCPETFFMSGNPWWQLDTRTSISEAKFFELFYELNS